MSFPAWVTRLIGSLTSVYPLVVDVYLLHQVVDVALEVFKANSAVHTAYRSVLVPVAE